MIVPKAAPSKIEASKAGLYRRIEEMSRVMCRGRGIVVGMVFALVTGIAGGWALAAGNAEIHGCKWRDVNADGVWDSNEPALAGWFIYLDDDRDGNWAAPEQSTLTEPNGHYSFTGLDAGVYVVAEKQEGGWFQTYPTDTPSAAPQAQAGPHITTTDSQAPIYTFGQLVPEPPGLMPDSMGLSQSGNLINMDDFRIDPRFSAFDGAGYAAVILDTGIDLDHPFFGPDLDENNVADRIVYYYDFADVDDDASDVNGHGSNVCSIVASEDPTRTGMSPGVDIIALKVFRSSDGGGTFGYVERALQWVVNNAVAFNIASVNISLGDSGNWNNSDPRYDIDDELAALAAMNVIVVSASGNFFSDPFNSVQGVAYPAADVASLSVGAVYDSAIGSSSLEGAVAYSTAADRVAAFSQRHETLTTVFAPGSLITGANATGTTATMHGTSQASPHVAGAVVLAQQLAEEFLGRRLSQAEFTDLLRDSAVTINDGDDEDDNVTNTGLNFPRIDMLALAEAIYAMYHPPGTHLVTVDAGQIMRAVNFGNYQFTCGGWCYHRADVNGDCYVDLADLLVVAGGWLDCGCDQPDDWCSGADVDSSGCVQLGDLSLLTDEWLLCTDPNGIDCTDQCLW